MAGMSRTGYDCKFLSEPADYLKCLICLDVARDPRQHEECGKLFCNECIEKNGRDKPCPRCKKTGTQFYKDHKSKREVADLEVMCDSVSKGCKWEGTVGMLEKHVDECDFTLISCPKKCRSHDGKVEYFMRRNLDGHLKNCPNRDYTCDYCGKKGTFAGIIDVHDKMCPKKIIPSPNEGCTATVLRQHIDEHVTTECEYTRTPCKYKRLGCEMHLKRKDMLVHEDDDKFHLHMAVDMTATLEEKVAELETKTNKLETKFPAVVHAINSTLKLSIRLLPLNIIPF